MNDTSLKCVRRIEITTLPGWSDSSVDLDNLGSIRNHLPVKSSHQKCQDPTCCHVVPIFSFLLSIHFES